MRDIRRLYYFVGMSVVAIGALISGGWALLRYALALPRFVRYLRRARITSIPKGPTPPLSLVKSVRGDVPGIGENLVRTLKQNYPDFEVIFAHEEDDAPAVAAIDAARTQVPDVEVRASTDGAQERRDPTVWASASVRPDPLYLRDAANGLQEGAVVTFPPVLFGLRSLGARLWGLLSPSAGKPAVTNGASAGRPSEVAERIARSSRSPPTGVSLRTVIAVRWDAAPGSRGPCHPVPTDRRGSHNPDGARPGGARRRAHGPIRAPGECPPVR